MIGAFILLILVVLVSSSGLSKLENEIYNASESELSSFKRLFFYKVTRSSNLFEKIILYRNIRCFEVYKI